MENTIMRFCRETHKFSYAHVAKHLGITAREYRKLEKGEKLITPEQTDLLGALYKVNGDYFFQAALQLQDLLSKSEIIKVLRVEFQEFLATAPTIKPPKAK
jgi:transcriptional regulator with XRE-family HTH domain